MSRNAWKIFGSTVFVFAAAVYFGYWPVVRPSQADGERWSDEFVAFVTGSKLLGSRGPATALLVPGAQPITTTDNGCVLRWQLAPHLPQTVSLQKIGLDLNDEAGCEAAAFAGLETWVRPSSGVTAAGLVRRLTDIYGAPAKSEHVPHPHRNWYRWRPTPGFDIDVAEPLDGSDDGDMLVDIQRGARSRPIPPTAHESGDWMDRFIASLTAPGLGTARRTTVLAILGHLRQPASEDSGCRRNYYVHELDAAEDQPLLEFLSILLGDAAAGECDEARLMRLDASIWQTGPVRADTFVARFTAKYGAPQVSENDRHEEVSSWQAEGVTYRITRDSKHDDRIFRIAIETPNG